MANLKIIIGSTRETRFSDRVVPWVEERAGAHGAFEVDVIDLRDWPLPFFQEHWGTIGDFRDPTYSDPVVKLWNQKIKEGDAFLVITPEYNHSIPAVLKNAFDNVFVSFGFRNKPLAAVGYSAGVAGAARAIEHLAHIAIEAEAVPLRNSVLVGKANEAFNEAGEPVDPTLDITLKVVLDDLCWWANALIKARAEGELPPGNFRIRAALEELSAKS